MHGQASRSRQPHNIDRNDICALAGGTAMGARAHTEVRTWLPIADSTLCNSRTSVVSRRAPPPRTVAMGPVRLGSTWGGIRAKDPIQIDDGVQMFRKKSFGLSVISMLGFESWNDLDPNHLRTASGERVGGKVGHHSFASIPR